MTNNNDFANIIDNIDGYRVIDMTQCNACCADLVVVTKIRFADLKKIKKKRNSKSFSIVRQINTNVYSRRQEIEVSANRGYIVIPYNESVFFFF